MSKLCEACSQKELCDGTGLPPELYSRIMLYLTIQDRHEEISFDHLVSMFRQQVIEFNNDVAGVFDTLVQFRDKCLYNV